MPKTREQTLKPEQPFPGTRWVHLDPAVTDHPVDPHAGDFWTCYDCLARGVLPKNAKVKAVAE